MKKTLRSSFAGIALISALIAQAITTHSAQAAPLDQPSAQRLRFAAGADTINRSGVLRFGGTDRYAIRLSANDDFSVSVDSGPNNNVILVIWGADGTVFLSDHEDLASWNGVTPSTQDYFIDVHAIDGTTANYNMSVYARPAGPNPPPPAPPRVKRIVFAPGSESATVTGKVTPTQSNEYVIKANAGQRMLINVTAEEQRVAISVVGADGTLLLSSMPGASSFSGTLPSTQDYYIKVIIQGEGFALYQMTVTIEALVY